MKETAFGGIVVNNHGEILLREPRGHFDHYVWTFPKGRQSCDETPEEAAIREVLEETGINAKIKGRLPGVYPGGTTDTIFFLMSPIEDTEHFDAETQSIKWVSPEEARNLISRTTNQKGRERDLKVLEEALRLI